MTVPRPTTVQIRVADPADAAEIADLHLRSRRTRLPYLPDLHTDEEVRSYFAGVVLPSCTVLVAVRAGMIIGFAAVAGASLEHLYIDPRHLRGGVGSALLEQVKAIRPGGLRLYVFQRNDDARAFYRAHGFVTTGFQSGKDNEENEPDLVMTWGAATSRSSDGAQLDVMKP